MYIECYNATLFTEIFQFSFRREACDIQATKARNDYVLALLAANAHQSKFYETDLPELVQVSGLLFLILIIFFSIF